MSSEEEGKTPPPESGSSPCMFGAIVTSSGSPASSPDANLLMSSDCLCFDNGDGVGRADLLPRDDDSGDERKLCEGVDGPA